MGDRVRLRILLDRSLAEVYVNDGEACLSALYFPENAGRKSLFYAERGAHVRGRLAGMGSIW